MAVSTELRHLRAVVAALPPAPSGDTPDRQRSRALLAQIVRLLSERDAPQDRMRA